MIGKGIFGKRFGSLLEYVHDGRKTEGVVAYALGAEHRLGPVAYANLAARTPEGAAREMMMVARRSTRVERPVFHLIVTLHPTESKPPDLQAEKLQRAAVSVVDKLGLAEHQAVYAVHMEKSHLHCHVAINRVSLAGKAWPMWRSARRIQEACREVERELGFRPHEEFQQAANSRKAWREPSPAQQLGFVDPGTWSVQERRIYERTGRIPDTTQPRPSKQEVRKLATDLREKISRLLAGVESWPTATQRLRAAGFDLELVETHQRRGLRIHRRDGKSVPASSVDRKFSLSALEARWGQFGAHLARSPQTTTPSIPQYVVVAHNELRPEYDAECARARQKRKETLAALRAEEMRETNALQAEAAQQMTEIAVNGTNVNAVGKTLLRLNCRKEYSERLRQLRASFGSRRRSIPSVPHWIDFVLKKARVLVQAAISVLSWVRRHRDCRVPEQRILPTHVCTPPEVFNHFRYTPTLIPDTGCVLYTDYKNRPGFIDRGDDIIVVVPRDLIGLHDRGDFLHVAAALEHGCAKWGGCKLPPARTAFFEYVKDVARIRRCFLEERFEDSPGASKRERLQPLENLDRPIGRPKHGYVPRVYDMGERMPSRDAWQWPPDGPLSRRPIVRDDDSLSNESPNRSL